MENKIERPFLVGVSPCDSRGRMAPDRILERFEDLACEHAALLGVGLREMNRRRRFWLTVKTRLRVPEAPRIEQRVVGVTWPARPGAVRWNRYYELRDEQGALLADGCTEWAVVDLDSGALVRSAEFVPELEFCPDTAAGEGFHRLNAHLEQAPLLRQYTVGSNDIDVGRHMNNVAYARALLGSFSDEYRRAHPVQELELCFRKPCYEGEVLDIRGRETGGGWELAVYRPEGEAALLARMK